MFAILLSVVITMSSAILAAGVLAWISWMALGRTRYPGLGPIVAFAMLVAVRNAGQFTQVLLMFSAIFAVGAFATLFGSETRRKEKSSFFRNPS